MIYSLPADENGKPYFVPIVAKNKDYLIGYLRGIDSAKDIMHDVLASVNIEIDLDTFDAVLDSTRFNDLFENGKYGSDMSDEELEDYIYDIVENITDKVGSDNSENNLITGNVLSVECSCDLGYYAWRYFDDIPNENFKCVNCGKILIHYTGEYDYKYDYTEKGLI